MNRSEPGSHQRLSNLSSHRRKKPSAGLACWLSHDSIEVCLGFGSTELVYGSSPIVSWWVSRRSTGGLGCLFSIKFQTQLPMALRAPPRCVPQRNDHPSPGSGQNRSARQRLAALAMSQVSIGQEQRWVKSVASSTNKYLLLEMKNDYKNSPDKSLLINGSLQIFFFSPFQWDLLAPRPHLFPAGALTRMHSSASEESLNFTQTIPSVWRSGHSDFVKLGVMIFDTRYTDVHWTF